MGNSMRRLTGRESEETIMSAVGPSATADDTSNSRTAVEESTSSSVNVVALGDCGGAGSSVEPKSEYFSPRIAKMMRSKSQFSSPVDHEIEHSRVHWSEVSGPSDSSHGSKDNEEVNEDSEEANQKYEEEVDRENEEVFTELMNDPQWWNEVKRKNNYPWRKPRMLHFFSKFPPYWKLGRKIAEGGQAEIFELIRTEEGFGSSSELLGGRSLAGVVEPFLVLKVFKKGIRLKDLKKQWPRGILQWQFVCIVRSASLLDDGRFAFWLGKCWGDLRKLIDQAMQEKNNQHPPFPYEWDGKTVYARDVMREIASQMDTLHKHGILHRDLKASNILVQLKYGELFIYVADFECSIGVVGTGLWRAPEILLGLKKQSAIDFLEKTDVYSYAMTCFEIVCGCLPFEDELEVCRASHDLIINGQRPKLPNDLDVTLRGLIERCWNGDPNKRPSFLEIIEALSS